MEQKDIIRRLRRNKWKKIWMRITGALICLVVFCTTYALILPAITMETPTFCNKEEHIHNEDCYTQTLICEVHSHTDACYVESRELQCMLEEKEEHIHTEICAMKEEKVLICEQEEHEGHTHTDKCMQQTVSELICGQEETEEHLHNEDCYNTVIVYECGQEEVAGHSHSDACYTTVITYGCGQEESEGHTHSEECYADPVRILQCELEADPEHIHTDVCYTQTLHCEAEEHEHDLACYADPTADVETAADWETSLPELLEGRNGVNVIRVAQSQLGYTESSKNYIVADNGEMLGYTRYGEWYGDPYGHWCAMFAAFCLSYAQVEDMPLDSNCDHWIQTLKSLDMYEFSGQWKPKAGDLVFFDWNEDAAADHVGIVAEYIESEESLVGTIRTIEGNINNSVGSGTYSIDTQEILGYGVVPMQEEEAVQAYSVVNDTGNRMYHHPSYAEYQYSSHRVSDCTVQSYVLIPYDLKDTWTPNTLEWSVGSGANYAVAYGTDRTAAVSEAGAEYVTRKIQESGIYNEHASELAGIAGHAYPFITSEEMKEELAAAYEAGQMTEDVSCCTESEFIAAAQWAIWDAIGLSGTQTKASDAEFPLYNMNALNPLTNAGHTDPEKIQSHVKAIRDWLIAQQVPEDLTIADQESKVTKNADGTYKVETTVTLGRALEPQETIDGVFQAGDHEVPISVKETGTKEFMVSLDGLTAEEVLSAIVELDVSYEHMQVYVYEGGQYQDMISGQWEVDTYPLSVYAEVETTSAKAVKYWSDNEIGAESVSVQLYADGVPYGNQQLLCAENDWQYTWEKLLKYSAEGTEIEYTVREVLVSGYHSEIVMNRNGPASAVDVEFIITNTKTEELTSVQVIKEWAGRDDGKYPESVQVVLLQNGEPYGEAVTLNQENEWKYCWEELPLKLGDTKFTYSIEEVLIDNYEVTVETETDTEGTLIFTLCNTWSPEMTSLELLKTDAVSTDKVLGGAQFKLYIDAQPEEAGAASIPGMTDTWGILQQTATTDPYGVFRMKDVLVGEKYYLVETVSPSGYNPLEEPIVFRVEKADEETVLTILSDTAWAYAGDTAAEDDTIVLQVLNTQIYILPETGGTGISGHIIAGSILVCMSLFLLLYIRKRYVKETMKTS